MAPFYLGTTRRLMHAKHPNRSSGRSRSRAMDRVGARFVFYILILYNLEREGPSRTKGGGGGVKPTLNFLFIVQSSIKSIALMMTAYQLSPWAVTILVLGVLSLIFISSYIAHWLLWRPSTCTKSEDDPFHSVLFSENSKRTDTSKYFYAISTILNTRPRLSRTRRWLSS